MFGLVGSMVSRYSFRTRSSRVVDRDARALPQRHLAAHDLPACILRRRLLTRLLGGLLCLLRRLLRLELSLLLGHLRPLDEHRPQDDDGGGQDDGEKDVLAVFHGASESSCWPAPGRS